MLNAASAVPALIASAKNPNEIPRVREHALRVAIRLDASKTPEAIQSMANDRVLRSGRQRLSARVMSVTKRSYRCSSG